LEIFDKNLTVNQNIINTKINIYYNLSIVILLRFSVRTYILKFLKLNVKNNYNGIIIIFLKLMNTQKNKDNLKYTHKKL